MAIVDRSLRAREAGEEINAPSRDEEFVLYHSDNVEASGFVQHLKLPHYVDFQADLQFLRRLRKDFQAAQARSHEQQSVQKVAAE
jgi:alpha-D-ribose 1-methylphosphonate 5-triphosphate synthase subunit PhnI